MPDDPRLTFADFCEIFRSVVAEKVEKPELCAAVNAGLAEKGPAYTIKEASEDGKMDSLDGVEVAMAVEERVGFRMKSDKNYAVKEQKALEEAPTVGALYEVYCRDLGLKPDLTDMRSAA